MRLVVRAGRRGVEMETVASCSRKTNTLGGGEATWLSLKKWLGMIMVVNVAMGKILKFWRGWEWE